MSVPLFLLKCIGRAGLNVVGVGVLGDVMVDLLPDVAREVWRRWQNETTAGERREELQAIAVADPGAYQAAVTQAVREIVDEASQERKNELPPDTGRHLTEYLLQLQSSVRRTFRRPEDRQGLTTPHQSYGAPGMDSAAQVLALLPAGRSRFSPGDRPLSGVDWELVELLGAGGFGEVWKAKHAHLSSIEPVALKFCLDPSAATLLAHEAEMLDRVMRQGRHEGIVQLRHTYLGADPPCLEYELVEGGDLAAWMRGRRPHEKDSILLAATIILQLAEITTHAHRSDPAIVHRDLKPANVLVAAEGVHATSTSELERFSLTLKIADFGIGGVAARKAVAHSRGGVTAGQMMTQAVRGAHTPLYGSPQQMRGEDPDPRDDVYALGVIWHQLLVGDLTVGAPSGRKWMEKLAAQGMTPEQIELLAACIEADAADRPQDAGVLHARLRQVFPFLSKTPSPSKTSPPKVASVEPAAVQYTLWQPTKQVPVKTRPMAAHPEETLADDGVVYNSMGMKFRRIKPGSFLMGSAEGELEDVPAAEQPVHRVEISQPFWMGVFPVTERDYQQLMGVLPRPLRFGAALDARCPMRQVSWLDAAEFCNRLSQREGRTSRYQIRGLQVRFLPGDGYQLPTEAQWEYACRAGSGARYFFGDRPSILADWAWFEENAQASPQPVGGRSPNPWGLYDMHGNVWEWCGDWFHESYYRTSISRDPQGPGAGHLRVVRGGSFTTPPAGLRCAARDGADPQGRYDDVGFRIVSPLAV